MSAEPHAVSWHDSGREPQCPPNAAFPDGVTIDVSEGIEPTCTIALPYPARRCGSYHIRCNLCGWSVAVTTAGRPDDPKSIKLPCKTRSAA